MIGKWTSTGLALALVASMGTASAAERLGAEAIEKRWPNAEQWPVVDARSADAASKRPVPGSTAYPPGPDWGLEDSRGVVVLAPDEGGWQEMARKLEERVSGHVVVVAGGFEGLKILRGGKMYRPQATADALPEGANTPSGTCKPGEPLHTFDGDDSDSGKGTDQAPTREVPANGGNAS